MIPTREQIEGDWGDPRYSMATVVRTWLRAMRDEIDRLTAANEAGGAALLDAQREAAKLRAELAALKPSEDREAAIQKWEACALAIKDDGDYHPIDVYRVTLGEIRAAVALMRSAGDGKALLRELLAWSDFAGVRAETILMKIKEMLAQPAPVEKPAAAVPKDDGSKATPRFSVEHRDYGAVLFCNQRPSAWVWNFGPGDEMKRTAEGVCRELNKLASPPVAAAVPDDTRELVAQLADVVQHLCITNKQGSRVTAIAAELRGGA